MILRSISVTNFKCFQKLRLELSQFTLFTGFNAAGKSTAIQPILLLAQALQGNRASNALSLNGPLVRLGMPGDVIASNPSSRSVVITVETEYDYAQWNLEPQERSLVASERELGVLKIASAEYKATASMTHTWRDTIWSESVQGSDRIDISVAKTVYLSAVRAGTVTAFDAVDGGGRVHADVGVEGQFAPWWYAYSADDVVEVARRHPLERASSLRRQLDAYLSDLFPGAQANAEYIARTSLVRLEFKTSTTSDWRRPANVGYGLTYAFPILVALLLALPGQIVIIDSPEAHLHPRAQSKMGSMLARFAKAGVQVLVETHSDHVLNGVRLAVREGLIGSNDVAIHFFSGPTESEHGIISLRIDKNGTLDAWPDGFFDQSERDLTVLAGWGD
jgi:predicted ATPase